VNELIRYRHGGNKARLPSTPSFPNAFFDGLGPSHIITSLASMSNLSRPVAPLPQLTRARLRSSQILTTLAQIISELVQNSLDAGAKHVDVGVDAEGWECWVRDDGYGLSRQDLGKLEGRYSESLHGANRRCINSTLAVTSKAQEPHCLAEASTFGFRGEGIVLALACKDFYLTSRGTALASAADLCCLEISSRTKHSTETWSVILKVCRASLVDIFY
jgi:DNA mismatch repair protein MLH3